MHLNGTLKLPPKNLNLIELFVISKIVYFCVSKILIAAGFRKKSDGALRKYFQQDLRET